MTITVEGPGFSVDFPDGTDEKTINKQMSIANAQMRASKRDPSAHGGWSVGNTSRALLRGLPFVGQYRDEASAAVRSALPSWMGGQSYDDALKLERDRDEAFQEKHPIADFGLGLAGGIGGTVAAAPLVAAAAPGVAAGAAGAGATGAVARTLLGLGSKTLPGAIARGATAGAAQGAAAGAGAAEGGFVERGMGALQGGGIGAVAGGGIPAILGAGRNIASNLIERTGAGDALSRLNGSARNYVRDLAAPAEISRVESELARLGPQAMLADVSPEFMMVARGAAARPSGRNEVVLPLEARTRGSNQRLQGDLNEALGPAPVPSQIEAGLATNRATGGAMYEQPMQQARAVNTRGLAEQLEADAINTRGPAQRAVTQVRGMLDVPGTPGQLDPNPQALLSTRQAIDGMLTGETNPDVVRRLTTARQRVDAQLAEAAPGIKDADALQQELHRQSAGLQRGTQVLDVGKTATRPVEMANEMTAGALPQGNTVGPSGEAFRIRQGLRGEVDRIVGTNGNDALAIQRTMRGAAEDGAWNPQKLETVFGAQPAQDALRSVDREVLFQGTRNRVAGGSDTAAAQGFRKTLDAIESPMTGGMGASDVTATGLALNAGKRLMTMAIGAVGQARANRFASELGAMSVAQGTSRDEFVAAMKRIGMNRAQTERAYNIAEQGGLIAARETPSRVLPSRQ